MKLRLEFGIPATKKLQVHWFETTSPADYHSVVKYADKVWELISYKADPNNTVEYVLIFDEVPEHKIATLYPYDLDFHYNRLYANDCECGAIYERGFEDAHSFWCKKWTKV